MDTSIFIQNITARRQVPEKPCALADNVLIRAAQPKVQGPAQQGRWKRVSLQPPTL
jgi:hypothetical protein